MFCISVNRYELFSNLNENLILRRLSKRCISELHCALFNCVCGHVKLVYGFIRLSNPASSDVYVYYNLMNITCRATGMNLRLLFCTETECRLRRGRKVVLGNLAISFPSSSSRSSRVTLWNTLVMKKVGCMWNWVKRGPSLQYVKPACRNLQREMVWLYSYLVERERIWLYSYLFEIEGEDLVV